MSNPNKNNMISRRRFLAVLGAASLASGAVGAKLTGRRLQGTPTVISVAPSQQTYNDPQYDRPPAEANVSNPAELTQAQDQVAKLTAENSELKSVNEALQKQLDALQSTQIDQTSQVTDLETRLASVSQERTAALGLVALYEQLESVDIAGTFKAGFNSVGEAWDDFIDDVPDASTRLEQAKSIVSDFDAQIPTFQTARNWLAIRIDLLRRENNYLQNILSNISEKAGSVLEMLGSWFDEIRSWLPSRFLETANTVIDALLGMVSGVPVTIEGTQSNVLAALDDWFADDNDNERTPIIRKRLFNPLTQETLPQAVSLLQKTRIAKQKYEANLVTQVNQTMQKREALENLIVEFRERNNLQEPQA